MFSIATTQLEPTTNRPIPERTETLARLNTHVQSFPKLQRKLTFEIRAKAMFIFIQPRVQFLNFCCYLSNFSFQALDGNPV
jgi:hypothetical protein